MISSSSMTRIERLRFIVSTSYVLHKPSRRRPPPMDNYAADAGGISRSVPAAGLGNGRQRQRQGKAGSLSLGAVARDGAAVLLHDPVRDREAEARALTEFLRGEEGIVDPRHLFGRDTRPR